MTDFQDPAKLGKLLNQFVALGTAQTLDPTQNPAVQLLNGASSTNIINLTLPAQTTITDSYSSASVAAMLLSTAGGG
jgi:hypothetical protein